MPSGVTHDTLRNGLLVGLLGPNGPLAAVGNEVLQEAIVDAEAEVEQDLSTRFEVTEFRPHMDAGAPPAEAGFEVEGPYEWPGELPGDRFPAFVLRVRPVVELIELKLQMPGVVVAPLDVDLKWFRVDHMLGEVTLAPTSGATALQWQGLGVPFGLLGGHQLPDSVLIRYKAGLGEAGLKKWPKIKRLVALRAALQVLPSLGIMLNPTGITSQSADGLSESRRSGYIFQDLEDRLRREADEARDHILSLWEGPSLVVV